MDSFVEIDYIEVVQPIGSFYIGKISWQDLINIAKADIRRIDNEENKTENFDSYIGIQRNLSKGRIREISDYVKTVDATFPSSIILAIDSESRYLNGNKLRFQDAELSDKEFDSIETKVNIKVDEKKKKLLIRKDDTVASILDGQHRLEGLRSGFENADKSPSFELNVTIFVDIDIDDQAQIFSIINKAQTKVNKSLVYDLYEYANTRSPQKTAHDIVRILNKEEQSPFYRKVKVLGNAQNSELETITQATLVEKIISYISNEPMKDRDNLKRKAFFWKTPLEEGDPQKFIFRKFFIEERDELILNILWNYFEAAKKRWPKAWDENVQGNILNKSTGIIALMRFLRPIVNYFREKECKSFEKIPTDTFYQVFKKVQLENESFKPDNFKPGTTGQAALYKEFLKSIETSG